MGVMVKSIVMVKIIVMAKSYSYDKQL